MSGSRTNKSEEMTMSMPADRRITERFGCAREPLRSCAGYFLDRGDEIYLLRGERHPTTRGKQSVYGMAVWVSQRARIFKFTRSSGNCYRSDDWAALASAAGVGDRERAGDSDVSNDAELSIFDTRLGAQLGRIPGFSGRSGAVLVKRYRLTRCVYLVIGRVAGIHRCEQKLSSASVPGGRERRQGGGGGGAEKGG